MPDMLTYFVIFAAVIQLIGGVAYVRDTLAGRARPNRVSWILWAATPIIGTGIILLEGTQSWAVLPIFMSGFIPLMVLTGSFFNTHAYWKLGTFDYVCAALGGLALTAWLLADQPVMALVLLVATDGFAALPTIRKAWTHPETETGAPFIAALFGGFAALVSVQDWVILEYAFPVYLFGINWVLLYSIYRRRIFKCHSS
ncbi:MAG: hypothetical protein HOA30_04560 [Rhodospirillaceae bacterium]|nr:hypothetical protein [Rhodospirillaceae bacterium]